MHVSVCAKSPVCYLTCVQLLFSFQNPFINIISLDSHSSCVGSTEKVLIPERRIGRKFQLVFSSSKAADAQRIAIIMRMKRKIMSQTKTTFIREEIMKKLDFIKIKNFSLVKDTYISRE